jgi:hypothetical protein
VAQIEGRYWCWAGQLLAEGGFRILRVWYGGFGGLALLMGGGIGVRGAMSAQRAPAPTGGLLTAVFVAGPQVSGGSASTGCRVGLEASTLTGSHSRSLGRRPTDAAARERLREAQSAEAKVVAAYYAAAARAEAARAVLADSESQLGNALEAVVAISGQSRALALLGLDKAGLRQALNNRRPR